MTVARWSVGASVSPRRVAPATVGLGVAISLLLLLTPSAAASSYGTGGPVSWSNGIVLCNFASGSPSVAVSHATMSGTGMTISLLSLFEAGPDQVTVASANLSGLTWTVANLSTDEAYDLSYTVDAPLVGPSPGSTPVGSATLTVQFVLPAYAGSSEGSTDTVNVFLSVDHWTWQAPGDHLSMAFAVAPSFTNSEHLNATSAPGWLLASTSNASGAELERMGANASATAVLPTGTSTPIEANASVAIASPGWAMVSVAFGTSAGEFSSLQYLAHVGVVLPATVVGIPLPELFAVAVGAIGVSLAVAVATQRIRRRPSTLIYAPPEDEER